MVNNLSSYSQHLAEFPLFSIGAGSIPTHISFHHFQTSFLSLNMLILGYHEYDECTQYLNNKLITSHLLFTSQISEDEKVL